MLTPSSSNRKPLSSLTGLSYPTINSKHKKENENSIKWSRVLTSAEAIALLEKKARRKKEEEQAKELKEERMRRKETQREEEKKKKAEERVRKEAERKKKAEEREQIEKQKAKAREAERWYKVGLNLANRENCSSRRRSVVEDVLQEAEINSIECAACFRLYEDDVADGQLTQGWIQCTENSCGKWIHVSCLDTDGEMCICSVCKNIFC